VGLEVFCMVGFFVGSTDGTMIGKVPVVGLKVGAVVGCIVGF